MKPYLNEHGFFHGEINPDYMSEDFKGVMIDADPPPHLPPRFFSWAWDGLAWQLATDNRGRLWYLASDTQVEYIGSTPSDTPPDGYIEFVNGTGKVAGLVESLRNARTAKWTEIKQARAADEYAGFTWDGSVFDSHPVATGHITDAALMAMMAASAGRVYVNNWRLQDNTLRTLSGDDMMAVGGALDQHIKAARNRADELRLQIGAANSPEAVAAIAWSGVQTL